MGRTVSYPPGEGPREILKKFTFSIVSNFITYTMSPDRTPR